MISDYEIARKTAATRSIPSYRQAIPSYDELIKQKTIEDMREAVTGMERGIRQKEFEADIGMTERDYARARKMGGIDVGLSAAGVGLSGAYAWLKKIEDMQNESRMRKYQNTLNRMQQLVINVLSKRPETLKKIYAPETEAPVKAPVKTSVETPAIIW